MLATPLIRLSSVKAISVISILAILLFQCKRADQVKGRKNPTLTNSVSVSDSIFYQVNQLNKLSEKTKDFYDKAAKANQKITKLLLGINDINAVLKLTKANFQDRLTVAISKDTLTSVISWYTRLGGTGQELKSIILYIKNNSIESFVLDETSSLRFDTIYMLKFDSEKPVYLFKGTGQSSAVEFFSSIYAYTINNGLKKAAIFPDETNSITISHQLENPIDFKVANDATEIHVPNNAYPYNNWGTTYRLLSFDGKNYQKETIEINLPLNESTFRISENYEDGYLKGSEKPIESIQNEKTSQFSIIFKDGTTVLKSYSSEDEATVLKIKLNDSNEPQILHFSSYDARILAKKHQYLFVELSGTTSSAPLLVYDTKKQLYISSISQAGLMLYNDDLLFSQIVDNNSDFKGKPTCNPAYGDQTRFFETFILDYRSNYPTVKATGMIYCGFSE